jgi:hypothetical protein
MYTPETTPGSTKRGRVTSPSESELLASESDHETAEGPGGRTAKRRNTTWTIDDVGGNLNGGQRGGISLFRNNICNAPRHSVMEPQMFLIALLWLRAPDARFPVVFFVYASRHSMAILAEDGEEGEKEGDTTMVAARTSPKKQKKRSQEGQGRGQKGGCESGKPVPHHRPFTAGDQVLPRPGSQNSLRAPQLCFRCCAR